MIQIKYYRITFNSLLSSCIFSGYNEITTNIQCLIFGAIYTISGPTLPIICIHYSANFSPCYELSLQRDFYYIILPSVIRSSDGLFLWGFMTKIFYALLTSPLHSAFHTNFILCEIPNIRWKVQIIKLSLYNFFQPPITSCLLGTNILLSTLFSNTLNLFSAFNVRGKFHIHKKQAKL
jgi:hypothetical protein